MSRTQTILGLGALVAAAFFLAPAGPKEVVFVLSHLLTGIAISGAARSGSLGLPWYLLGAGGVVSGIGTIFWTLDSRVLEGASSFVTVANVLWVLSYMLLTGALLGFIRARTGRLLQKTVLFDGLILLSGAAMLLWILVIRPLVSAPQVSTIDLLWASAFPLMDIVLLTCLGGFFIANRTRSTAFWLLAIGFGSVLVGDFGYHWLAATGKYELGAVTDGAWFAALPLLVAAAFHPSRKALTEPTSHPIFHLTKTRLVIFMIVATATPVAEYMIKLSDATYQTPLLLTAGELGLGFLVFSRVLRMVAQSRATLMKLHDTELRYRTLVEHIPAVVYIDALDEASTTVYVSPQLRNLVGFTPAEWQDDPMMWSRQLHPEDRDKTLSEHERAVSEGRDFDCEYRIIAKDGRVVWLRDEAHLIEDLHGKWWHGLLVDITEEKTLAAGRSRLEAHLNHAQKMEAIGQLAGGAAHDFNNLLTVIRGYIQFAIDELGPDSRIADDLREAVRASDRGAALVKQLLAVSRHDRGIPVSVSLNDLIVKVEGMVRQSLRGSITLELSLTGADTNVVVDESQIERVLLNLAVNARDAMPEGGTLRMRTSVQTAVGDGLSHLALPDATYVMLEVADTGCGISDEVKGRLFDPFFTTKPPGEGTGLGLSVAYGVIAEVNGAIDVNSKPGHGTTFTIYLPTAAGDGDETDPRGTDTAALSHDPAER